MKTFGTLLASAALAGLSALAPNAASADGIHMYATLLAGSEIPSIVPPDPLAPAHGSAALIFRVLPPPSTQNQVCVTMTVNGLDTPTAAHIHRGFGQTNGPVVVTLVHPAAANSPFASGCKNITPVLMQEIIDNRYGFYINVHTQSKGGGAIRGQLF